MNNAHAAPIRVMLVDDHRSVLWGLERLIDGEKPRMQVVATATSHEAAKAALAEAVPDVILLDLDLGGAIDIDVIADFTTRTSARVLVLTGLRDQALHDRAVLAGARGVVTKDRSAETIITAIERVHHGELWLDRAATGRIFVELSRKDRGDDAPQPRELIESLTPRERAIVTELASDASATTRDIARKLSISEHTLRNHLSSIYGKLGVSTRLGLWVIANKHGLARQSA